MDISELKERWAELYDDKFPNNPLVKFDRETGEYSFLTQEERNELQKKRSSKYLK